jgi:DNA-binding NarL/FixJ family response regulator
MNDTTTQLQVFLVENHNIVRAGIRRLLETMGIEVIGEAGDGAEAVQQLQHLAQEQRLPELVLMDLAMPRMNGLDATSHIMRHFPGVRVVILSMHTDEEYVLRALQAGASGYLLKDASPSELQQALLDAMQGNFPLSPLVSRHVIANYVRRLNGANAVEEAAITERAPALCTTPGTNPLTPRQTEILCLIAVGRTTREIATLLGLSVKTIETHRSALMERLDIHDVAGLVRYAIRSGLVTSDS